MGINLIYSPAPKAFCSVAFLDGSYPCIPRSLHSCYHSRDPLSGALVFFSLLHLRRQFILPHFLMHSDGVLWVPITRYILHSLTIWHLYRFRKLYTRISGYYIGFSTSIIIVFVQIHS